MSSRISIAQARKQGFQGGVRKTKYNNRKTHYNGRDYDSKAEANRAAELDFLKKAGKIKDWLPQYKFEIKVNGQKICDYYADFAVKYPNGQIEYEDVKGVKTSVYRLKKKLVKALYDVDIVEIYG